MQIAIDITGQKEIADILHRAGQRAANLSPAWPDFRGHMRASIEETFRAGGRPEKWPPSKRAESEGGGRTLMKDGHLSTSITFKHDNSSFTMGTADKRARVHQEGLTIVPKHAKALAIPINAPENVRPREFLKGLVKGSWFVKKGKGEGTGIIFQKVGGELIPLYALRKSVKMPKREFLKMLPENWDYLKTCLTRHILGEK